MGIRARLSRALRPGATSNCTCGGEKRRRRKKEAKKNCGTCNYLKSLGKKEKLHPETAAHPQKGTRIVLVDI